MGDGCLATSHLHWQDPGPTGGRIDIDTQDVSVFVPRRPSRGPRPHPILSPARSGR